MSRKSTIVLVVLALTITLGMTAITATMDVTDSGGTGDVDVDRSPLVIEDVNEFDEDGNALAAVSATTVTNPQGADRVSIEFVQGNNLEGGDEFTLQPELTNNADSELSIEIRTNTSDRIELVDFASGGVELSQETGVGDRPAVFSATLSEDADNDDFELTYEVDEDVEQGDLSGSFDVDLFIETTD